MFQLYHNRLRIIDQFPAALGKHRQLIVHLGLDGTSSEKEDADPTRRGVYQIKQRVEFSAKARHLKQ